MESFEVPESESCTPLPNAGEFYQTTRRHFQKIVIDLVKWSATHLVTLTPGKEALYHRTGD